MSEKVANKSILNVFANTDEPMLLIGLDMTKQASPYVFLTTPNAIFEIRERRYPFVVLSTKVITNLRNSDELHEVLTANYARGPMPEEWHRKEMA